MNLRMGTYIYIYSAQSAWCFVLIWWVEGWILEKLG